MSGYKNASKKKKQKADKKILLVWLAIAIVPLIVELIIRSNTLTSYSWFSSNGTEYDFFLRGKMYGVIAVMCLMVAVFVKDISARNNLLKEKGFKSKDHLMVLVFKTVVLYEMWCLFSSFMAHDKKAAFFGGYAQHEPFLVLLGYGVILLFTYCYINNENTLMLLYKLFLGGVAVMALIGLTQFFRADFFTSSFGKTLITMFSGIDPDRVNLKFEEGRVYMTLYNPNFVGSYVALVLPVVVAGIVILKKMWEKIAAGIIALMLVLCLTGSMSTTGMTAILVAVIVSAVVMIRNKKYIAISGAVLVAVVGIMVAINFDVVKQSISKYAFTPDDFAINKMEITEEGVLFEYKGNELLVTCEKSEGGGALAVADSDGNAVDLVRDESTGTIVPANDARFEGLSFGGVNIEEGMNGFYVGCGEDKYTFCVDEETGGYLYYNPYGKFTDDVVTSAGVLFDGCERFASGRGFIWSRSLALLGKTFFAGCGPDNFVYEFPNNDYLALQNNNYYGEVVTRPHNMYLQIGVQTGVISLILFILLYVLYFIQCVGIYAKKVAVTPLRIIGISVMTGTLGYMICGLANDSTICVAPVYFGLLGVGFACNYLVKKNEV